MTWVAQELSLWLVIAFVLGVLAGVVLSISRVTVEKWVEVPVEPEAAEETPDTDSQPHETPAATRTVVVEEPVFPEVEGVSPWEQQEAWARPATPVRTSGRSAGERDEWDDAAANWRTWADEATGRERTEVDEPLPGGGRRVAGASRPVEDLPAEPHPGASDPFPVPSSSAFPAPSDHDLFAADRAADGGPGAWDQDEDVFPAAAEAEPPDLAVPDVVVPPPSPVSDHELFAADRTAPPDEAVFPDAEPVFPDPAPVFPDPEPVFPEPEPVVEPSDVDAVAPPVPDEVPAPPREEHSPFDAASSGFVRRRRSERREDPEPLAEVFPSHEPEPAPVADVFPTHEQEPVADVFPSYEPEPVAEVFPSYQPEPEPDVVVPPPSAVPDDELFEADRAAPEIEPEVEHEIEPETEHEVDEVEDDYVPPPIHGPAGPGSMYAPIDGSVPRGYPIKGQASMMLYYPRSAKFYSRVVADVYFDTEEAAEHAGFTRWDRRGSAAHVIRPNAED